MGAALLADGRYRESEDCFTETLSRCPEITESTPFYFKAVKAMTHNNMGVLKYRQGDYVNAESHFRESLSVMPDAKDVQANLLRSRQKQLNNK